MDNSNNQKLHGLDSLRAFAIISVFLFHYFILSKGEPAWLPGAAKFGWTGVDLFFVLSGFLISSQLFVQVKAGHLLSFRDFFLKRFFRIIPAFLFTVGLYFCFPFFREKERLPPLWKFLTFTQNLGLNLKDQGTFSHCWSLCVEEHFYLLLPVILFALQAKGWLKGSWWWLLILFTAGFAIRAYSYYVLYLPVSEEESGWTYWYRYVYYPTYNRLDGLLAGVSVAAIYRFLPVWWSKLSKYGNWFIAAGIVLLCTAYFLCEDEMSEYASVYGFPLIAVAYGCIVMGAICPPCFLYKWNSTLLARIATLSYAIYLTHKGVIHVTHQLLHPVAINSNVLLLVSMCTSVAFAYLLHIAIEKPFMRLRQRFVK